MDGKKITFNSCTSVPHLKKLSTTNQQLNLHSIWSHSLNMTQRSSNNGNNMVAICKSPLLCHQYLNKPIILHSLQVYPREHCLTLSSFPHRSKWTQTKLILLLYLLILLLLQIHLSIIVAASQLFKMKVFLYITSS